MADAYDAFVPITWPGRLIAAAYVVAVVILTSIAWGHEHRGLIPALTFAALLGTCACINVVLVHLWIIHRTRNRQVRSPRGSAA